LTRPWKEIFPKKAIKNLWLRKMKNWPALVQRSLLMKPKKEIRIALIGESTNPIGFG